MKTQDKQKFTVGTTVLILGVLVFAATCFLMVIDQLCEKV